MSMLIANLALSKPVKSVDLQIVSELVSKCLISYDIGEKQVINSPLCTELSKVLLNWEVISIFRVNALDDQWVTSLFHVCNKSTNEVLNGVVGFFVESKRFN